MDYFVVRNLPFNLELEKFKELIGTAFSADTVKILEYVQGEKSIKGSVGGRCYVKITNKVDSKSSDAFLNFMDMRPFVNSKGLEEIALVERVYYTEDVQDPPNSMAKSNTIEQSKTYQTFLKKLNSPGPVPPSLDSLIDNLEKNNKEETSLILNELLNVPKKSGKKKQKPKADQQQPQKPQQKGSMKKKESKDTTKTTTSTDSNKNTTTTTTTTTTSSGGNNKSSKKKKSSSKKQQPPQQPIQIMSNPNK
ncbi:hypothetical protein DLAC_05288 [Tieghemostelium lacteum]|uniref:UPF3 domain-containing protein n=1 Tax=Tieghemostelium lacteum TaxID=361077 RepID=A0A151ZJA3_TIELA|nr:hypothetical protein DLAC_05288 [Tieghemostelium lacteum]|eukprot:KYQ93884.1 hypothetical protein DLAC_05288 [Tieghemostelium lacteum]